MPDLSSNLTSLRANSHKLQGYLTIFKGVVIAEATITAIPNNYPFASLDVSYTVGSSAVVERGQEVIVTTSAGLYKGRLRVRASGTISSTSLPIAEVSKATIEIVVGDKLKILSEHRLRPKLPEASGDFDPDKLNYSDQNSAVPPVALSGGAVCRWVDTGQTYATINFYGSGSYALDPDSGGTLTHAWTFPSGSTPTSSTSADPAGVQIPVGEWWVKHTVTDSSNSKTWTQYVPVRVHNTANPPLDVEINALSGDLDNGWSASFGLMDSLGQDDLPDGALAVFWLEETIAGSVQSFGNTYANRANNKIVGWVRSDESTGTAESLRRTIEVVSPLRILSEMAGFSKVLIDDASPANWQEMDELSVKLMIVQLLRWYTTATEIMDLTFSFTDYTYPRFYLQKQTPLEQVKELCDSVDARFIADRTCHLQVQLRPELTPLADRAAMTTTLTLADEDVIEFRTVRNHHRPVELLQCEGVKYNATKGLFSRYPGKAPGDGSQSQTDDRLITQNQTDLNTRTGLRGAWLDKVFINSSKERKQAPQMELRLFGSYDVFDFYKEWVATSLDETSNWAEEDYSHFRWLVQSISLEYLQGTATVSLNLQAETAAPAGTTYIPPAPDFEQMPEYTLDDYPTYNPQVDNLPRNNPTTDNIVAVTVDGHLLSTSDFSNASPTWIDVDISASLSGVNVVSWAVDATSPLYVGSGSTVNCWIMTRQGIDYVEDMFSATPTVTNQVALDGVVEPTDSGGYAGSMDADFTNNPGQYLVATYVKASANAMYSIFTTNGGGTWSSSVIIDVPTGVRDMCVAIDPHTALSAYVFAGLSEHLFEGSGGGWNELDDFSSGSGIGTNLFFPYAMNPIRYLYYVEPFSVQLKRIDFNTTENTVLPLIGVHEIMNKPINRGVISIPSGKPNRMMVITSRGSNRGALITDNAQDDSPTWTEVVALQSTNLWSGCALTDPDGLTAYLWGTGKIGWWDGSSVALKNGTGFTSARVMGIAGG